MTRTLIAFIYIIIFYFILHACSSNDKHSNARSSNVTSSQENSTVDEVNEAIDKEVMDTNSPTSIIGKWLVYKMSNPLVGDGFLLNSVITFTESGKIIFDKRPDYPVTYEYHEGYFISNDIDISLVKKNDILKFTADSLNVSTALDGETVIIYMKRIADNGDESI